MSSTEHSVRLLWQDPGAGVGTQPIGTTCCSVGSLTAAGIGSTVHWPRSNHRRAGGPPRTEVPYPTVDARKGLITDGYTGPVSLYADDAWSLDPVNTNPSAQRSRILWRPFPASMREELRHLGWLLINTDLPPVLLEGRHPATRTRISADSAYRGVLQWRWFAVWLHQRGVTSLTQCTAEHFREYAVSLARRPGVRRNAVCTKLGGLTRLWMLDQISPSPLNIPKPPWEREGVDDFLPAASASGENFTEALSPKTMGPLLIWALRVVDAFAEDILAAWAENRRLRTTAKTATRTEEGQARLNTYLADLSDQGRPMPSTIVNGRPRTAALYIAGITGASLGQVNAALNKRRRWREYLAAHPGGCPMPAPVNGKIGGMRWAPSIDYDEAPWLMRHLVTARFVVLSYLTGMRPGEVLGLRAGCCPDPDDTTQRHVIHGHVCKTAIDEDGIHLSNGELREIPWIAITPVVAAVRVLEGIIPDGELLFGSRFHQFDGRQGTKVALNSTGMREPRGELGRLGLPHRTTPGPPPRRDPPEPHSAIGTMRFRRTLAWHIARRPGGLIALTIQYGHMRTSLSAGYAKARELHQTGEYPQVASSRRRLDRLQRYYELAS
ncbi:integrase [Streptomyces sp. NPDC059816]|uniref:integrase n=1 Tax=Streptomyces sp. NPDC059816 TaxID=3346960 RepID=UPI0036530AD3